MERLDTWQIWGLGLSKSDLLACFLISDLLIISVIFLSCQLIFYLSFDSEFWWGARV